jgi:serine/threonine-protein kinase
MARGDRAVLLHRVREGSARSQLARAARAAGDRRRDEVLKNDGSDDRTLLSDSDAQQPTQVDGDESYCAACGGSYPFDVDVCPKDGARLAKLKAQPDALLGRVFDGRFEVRTALGQGGMGTVYRGWQLTVDREIAIKVIHPKLASDRVAVKRFLREARLSSRLNQPNIVNVYDFGQTEDGVLYIAMELLRGHTLARELEAMRPLPLRRVLTIGLQLCDALDAAHGQDIIHRDLKPGNIIILDDPPGRDLIKVLDFGLAKSLVADTSSVVTHTSAVLGTPLYMPPEQIEGRPSDQRADLYSLGCILYQMLSGRPPFLGDTVNVVLSAHISDPAPPLPATVPAALAQMVERLMHKDPARRMRSAREAREAMQAILEGGTLPSAFEITHDTTPDIRLPSVETGPVALAVTDPAHAATPPSQASSLGVGARTARWVAPVALLAAGAAIALGILVVVRTRDDRKPAPPAVQPVPAPVAEPADAMPIAEPDAASLTTTVVVDAAAPVDAATVTTKRQRPPRRKPAVKPPAPAAGSGSAEPSLPWLKRQGSGK